MHWAQKPLGCCLSQQLLLILGFWMRHVTRHDGPASRVEKILALNESQAIMWEQLIFFMHKMEVKTPFSCIGQSTRHKKWCLIHDWIYQIDMLLPKTSRHYVGTRLIFSTNELQTVCWQPKNLRCMILLYHKIIWANREFIPIILCKIIEIIVKQISTNFHCFTVNYFIDRFYVTFSSFFP